MLKHMPKDAVKAFERMLYSKENVVMPTGEDRRDHNTTTADNRMNANRTQRITKFSTQIGDHYMSRIPLRFLFDVSKVNQPIKIHVKVIHNLKRSVVKLFELNKNVTTLPKGLI